MNITVPKQLSYTSEHEWAEISDTHTATIGITNYAQNSLGDVIFVELPQAGTQLKQGDPMGVIESIKAASDLYAPLSGQVIAVNPDLATKPELVNQAPYNEGWMIKLKLTNTKELDNLLSPQDYQSLIV